MRVARAGATLVPAELPLILISRSLSSEKSPALDGLKRLWASRSWQPNHRPWAFQEDMSDCGIMTTVEWQSFTAYDQELDRDVAYKIMCADLASIRPIRDRFLQEARLTARLHHAGIVAVHGLISEAEGTLAQPMQCVAARARPSTSLPGISMPITHSTWDRRIGQPVLQHIIGVALTIQYAHEQGILHRDLSPRNIVAVGDDETLVLDWGLASRQAAMDSEERIHTRATRVGTEGYVAPEVWDESTLRPYSPQSDLYSIGALLHLVLTGRSPQPFLGGSVGLDLPRESVSDCTDIRAEDRIPRELISICNMSMSLDSNNRYATAEVLVTELGPGSLEIASWPIVNHCMNLCGGGFIGARLLRQSLLRSLFR